MSLKQSIVVVNEFTNNQSSRGGSTPGQYILRYLNREGAAEVLAPFNQTSVDQFVTRYMARRSATEALAQGDYRFSREALLKEFEDADQLGGRAFDGDELSLSHDDLIDRAGRIQDAYDQGHTVMKTVVSFEEAYLKDSGVLDKDFKGQGRGKYRGQIDQLKLRQAVQDGVNYMTDKSHFDDPLFVGVVQTDTEHVHAHLALCDEGQSPMRQMPDGSDRGKLTERDKDNLRFGIDMGLNELQSLRQSSRAYHEEQSNTRSYLERYTSEHFSHNRLFQSMVASLPEDKRHWRYGTNRKDMQRANALGSAYVQDVFDRHPDSSGYAKAMANAQFYADQRREREDLSDDDHARLISQAQANMLEKSVNGVYQVVKGFDDQAFTEVSAGVALDAEDDDDLLEDALDGDPLAGMMYRVRHHRRQQAKHKDMRQTIEEEREVFEDAADVDVDLDVYQLMLFYNTELQYHARGEWAGKQKLKPYKSKKSKEKVKRQYEQLQARQANDEMSGADYRADLAVYGRNAFELGELSPDDYLRTQGVVVPDSSLPKEDQLRQVAQVSLSDEKIRPPEPFQEADPKEVENNQAIDLHDKRALLALSDDPSITDSQVDTYRRQQLSRQEQLNDLENFLKTRQQTLHLAVYQDSQSEQEAIQATLDELDDHQTLAYPRREPAAPKPKRRQLPLDYDIDGPSVVEDSLEIE